LQGEINRSEWQGSKAGKGLLALLPDERVWQIDGIIAPPP
jgi:hypothetical protein